MKKRIRLPALLLSLLLLAGCASAPTGSSPTSTRPALRAMPSRCSTLSIAALPHLRLQRVVDPVGHGGGERPLQRPGLPRPPETLRIGADIGPAARLLPLEIQGDLSLRALDHPDELLLGLHLPAAHALAQGYFLGHFSRLLAGRCGHRPLRVRTSRKRRSLFAGTLFPSRLGQLNCPKLRFCLRQNAWFRGRAAGSIRPVKGLDKDETDKKTGKYIRQERYAGSCSRTFYVGEAVEPEDVSAKFENGILQLHILKKEAKKVEKKDNRIAIEG